MRIKGLLDVHNYDCCCMLFFDKGGSISSECDLFYCDVKCFIRFADYDFTLFETWDFLDLNWISSAFASIQMDISYVFNYIDLLSILNRLYRFVFDFDEISIGSSYIFPPNVEVVIKGSLKFHKAQTI